MTQIHAARAPERLLVATELAARDHGHDVLAPTSLELRTGRLLVAVGDPGPAHTVLALALAGRLSGAEGTVTLDGRTHPATRQESVALVDVPGVSEPDGRLPLLTVAGEELAMARRPARKRSVRQWLTVNRFGDHLDARMDELAPEVRVAVLCRLAALRPRLDFIVLVLPERHGEVPDGWLAAARELVSADFGVLVTASLGAAHRLVEHDDVETVHFGNATNPVLEPGPPFRPVVREPLPRATVPAGIPVQEDA